MFDCRAVSGFARAVKNISGGKSFTFAYNGYLFDLSDSRLTGSGHLDLSSLLQDANLDGIGSPTGGIGLGGASVAFATYD